MSVKIASEVPAVDDSAIAEAGQNAVRREISPWDRDHGRADRGRLVSVASDADGQGLLACPCTRALVRTPGKRAAVQDLDDVDEVAHSKGLERLPSHWVTDVPEERMLKIDEPARSSDPIGCLDSSESGGRLFFQKQTDELPVRSVDLLPDNDRKAGLLTKLESAIEPVVIGDRDDIDRGRACEHARSRQAC